MKRFIILDDDGFAVGRFDGTRADAERVACGRKLMEQKTPKKPTSLDRYRSAMQEAGSAKF